MVHAIPENLEAARSAIVNEAIRDMLALSTHLHVPAGRFSRIASSDPSFKKLK
jgi:hypothetical protein